MNNSDSDSDSDYDPTKDKENFEEDLGGKKINESELNESKKRKLDEAFDEMQKEDDAFIKEKLNNAVFSPISKYDERIFGNKRNLLKKQRELLRIIYGDQKTKNERIKGFLKSESNSSSELKSKLKESLSKIKKKGKVFETRKFAGQEIKVERTEFDSKSSSSGKGQLEEKSIDNLLETLKGPKTVSTVTKSSLDWDNFKEKEGLEEDLSTSAKDGYLTKQEFLNRCDVRSYVAEKSLRATNNAKK